MNTNSHHHRHYTDEHDADGDGEYRSNYFAEPLPEDCCGCNITDSIMGPHRPPPYPMAPASLLSELPYSSTASSLTSGSATSSSQHHHEHHQQYRQIIPATAVSASGNSYVRAHNAINQIEGHIGIYSATLMQQHQERAYMTATFDDHGDGRIFPQQHQQDDEWSYNTRMDAHTSPPVSAIPWAVGPSAVQSHLMIHSSLQRQQLPFHQAPLFHHRPYHSPSTTASTKFIDSEESEYLPSPSSVSGEDAVAAIMTNRGVSASFVGRHSYRHHYTDHSESTTATTRNFFPPLEDHHHHHHDRRRTCLSVIQTTTETDEAEETHQPQKPHGSNDHTQHSTATRIHSCIECMASFGRRQDLKRHASTVHKRVLPFECQSCHRHFSRKDSMLRHERNSCHHRRKRGSGMEDDREREEDEEEDNFDDIDSNEDKSVPSAATATKHRRRRSGVRMHQDHQHQL